MFFRQRHVWLLAAAGFVLAACSESVHAQNYTFADWSELRRRMEANLEMESLLWEHWTESKELRTGFTQPLPGRLSLTEKQRLVRDIACQTQVPPALLLAIVQQESGFNQNARGRAGELGASQILPTTAVAFSLDRRKLTTDIEYNVRGGARILKSLMEQFSEPQAAAAYNGGPDFLNSPPEVREKIERYVASVYAWRRNYAGIGCD